MLRDPTEGPLRGKPRGSLICWGAGDGKALKEDFIN